MTKREKRLGLIMLAVLVLVIAFLGNGWLGKQRETLRAEVAELEAKSQRAHALLPSEAEILKQEEWLDAHRPSEPLSTPQAQSQLQADLQRTVADSGVIITDQQLLEPGGVGDWGQARVRVSLRGNEETLLRLIAQFRSPEQLQAPEALRLNPNEDLNALEAIVTVQRLYHPLDAASSDTASR